MEYISQEINRNKCLSEKESSFFHETCVACQIEQSAIKIKDCGHMCLCLECISIIGREDPICPLCRKDMINFCFIQDDFFIDFYLPKDNYGPVESSNYEIQIRYAFRILPPSIIIAIRHIKASQPDYVEPPREVLTEEQKIQLDRKIHDYLEECYHKYHDVEISQGTIDWFTRHYGYPPFP